MTDAAYDVVAAFVARLAALGVTEAVISPGSRSTPLTLCFHAQPRISTWIQLDERSAGFFALGLGRATGRPAVLVCTSGTAAANYLPAVVEAFHAGVPMIVCTADRPPELRGWGSPQTIDQVGLYGTAVRWSIDLPVPDEATPEAAAGWAEMAVGSATGADPGPVHLNWPLREPLEPISTVPAPAVQPADVRALDTEQGAGPLDPTNRGERVRAQDTEEDAGPLDPTNRGERVRVPHTEEDGGRERLPEFADLVEIVVAHERGVVVVGPWPGGGLDRERRWAAASRRFGAWAGWPVIGEPITHVRGRVHDGDSSPYADGKPTSARERARDDDRGRFSACVVATADHLLADEDLAEALRPDVAVVVGRTVTTKPVRLWLERTRPRHVVLIDPEDRWEQAVFRLTGHVPATVEALGLFVDDAVPPETLRLLSHDPAAGAGRMAASLSPSTDRAAPGGWLDTWRKLDAAARSALKAAVDDGSLLSARTARVLIGALPDDAVLVATNSMPVRDLDAFVLDTGSVVCCANRGAAGIDGTASAALGIAAADPSRTVALYTGDLALLHDLGGLTAAARLGLHLIAVCVDNDGGEIFSMLPVADRIPADDFERLFRTPHGLDLCELDGFGGIRARRMDTADGLAAAVDAATAAHTPGVDLLVVEVPRDDDVAQRRAVTAAVQQAAHRALAASRTSDGL